MPTKKSPMQNPVLLFASRGLQDLYVLRPHVTVGGTRQNLNIVSIVNGTGAITNRINYGDLIQ